MRMSSVSPGPSGAPPVGGLPGGRVDRACRGRAQHPLHGSAVEDLDLVGFEFFCDQRLDPAPAVGRAERRVGDVRWRGAGGFRATAARHARRRRVAARRPGREGLREVGLSR